MRALRGLRYRAWVRRRRLAAAAGGYYWLPCPSCGEHYAGNESRGAIFWEITPEGARGLSVCPWCSSSSSPSGPSVAALPHPFPEFRGLS